jgi:hypothetical protein
MSQGSNKTGQCDESRTLASCKLGNACYVADNVLCTHFTVADVVSTKEVSKSKSLSRQATVIVSI